MSKNNGKVVAGEPDLKVNPEILARFNPATGEFSTKSGHALKFRPISAGVLDRVQMRIEERRKEPTPPDTEIDHGKGRVSVTPNVNDEWYLFQHAKWRRRVQQDLAIWVYAVAVEVNVPDWKDQPESVFHQQMLLEEGSSDTKDPNLVKYLYICSLLNSEEYSFLFEAIIGQATVTKLGLQEAAADFPS